MIRKGLSCCWRVLADVAHHVVPCRLFRLDSADKADDTNTAKLDARRSESVEMAVHANGRGYQAVPSGEACTSADPVDEQSNLLAKDGGELLSMPAEDGWLMLLFCR